MRKIVLGKKLSYLLNTLQQAGYEAYVVGGFVRDKLLKRKTNDADITTNATPEQIKQVFHHLKTIDVGQAFGTIVVVYRNTNYEITTYRNDMFYSDHRHPDKICFSKTIEEDLKRRDFTINALAYNNQNGFIDLNNGIRDLNNQTIRAIGEPKKRFQEDALRILRAIRFSSQLNFKIEPLTAYQIIALKENLLKISKERCHQELSKIFLSDYFENILFQYKEIFELFFKNLCYINDKEYIKRIEKIKSAPKDLAMRYAIFLNNVDYAISDLFALKYDKSLIHQVGFYLTHGLDFIDPNCAGVKSYLAKYSIEEVKNLLLLQQIQETITLKEYQHYLSLIEQIIQEKQCYCLKDLAINGNDLIKLGYRDKEIGETLQSILQLVINEEIPNNYYEILETLPRKEKASAN